MTSRPIQQTPATGPAGRFPEFPPRDDMQNSIYLDDPAHQAVLRRHFGTSDTIIVLGEVPIGRNLRPRQGLRVPDLLVAFDVDRAGIIARRGYSIEEQGKPPDFVLEIASENTGQDDYREKRTPTRPSAYRNTGGSTPPGVNTMTHRWPGTSWWTASTSPSTSSR